MSGMELPLRSGLWRREFSCEDFFHGFAIFWLSPFWWRGIGGFFGEGLLGAAQFDLLTTLFQALDVLVAAAQSDDVLAESVHSA